MRHAWGHKLQRFRLEWPYCLFPILCPLHWNIQNWYYKNHWTYTVKNKQVATHLLTSYNTLLHQADIRMRSHNLRQLVDDKSIASRRETCCKLVVKTGHRHTSCNLFQQVATSMQTTSCNKPELHRLVATWLNWQVLCNLLTSAWRFRMLCSHTTYQTNAADHYNKQDEPFKKFAFDDVFNPFPKFTPFLF